MKTMNCIVKKQAGIGHLVIEKRPIPEIGHRDVLVKVQAAAICGTDIHIQEWNEWAAKRVAIDTIIGHEFAGEVVEIGKDVTSIKVGDIVSAETHIACNTCDLCYNGHKHVCYNTQLIGVTRDGCFAEYISIPAENTIICDPKIPIEILSMMEPLGVAVHAVMEFSVASKSVAVIGCGPIGLMAVAVAKMVGAKTIIAVEPNTGRAKQAQLMGAHYAVNPTEEDPVKKIKNLTDGKGVDVILEFSGNIQGIKSALSYCKPEAKIAAVGLPSKPVDFDFAEFVYRGLSLKGIAGRLMYQSWEQAKGLLEAGLDISPVASHVMSMTDFAEGLHLMKDGECVKVILKPTADFKELL